MLTAQMLVEGHPSNGRESIFANITDLTLGTAVMTEFNPMRGSLVGKRTAAL